MGVTFLRIETVRQDMLNAKIRPALMTSVLATRFVAASVEQIPSTCLTMGFSLKNPRLKTVDVFSSCGTV
jgi:hypothetical protein